MAGRKDRVVKHNQALRLQGELPRSILRLVPGVGHMVHYAVPDEVARAIEQVGEPTTIYQRAQQGGAEFTRSAA